MLGARLLPILLYEAFCQLLVLLAITMVLLDLSMMFALFVQTGA